MFDFANSLPADSLPATGPWTGFPAYNFVGGHNDEALIPVDELADCVLAVMAAHGKRLATYGLGDGPLGYLGLRQFLAGSLKSRAGMHVDTEEILLLSGSLQALDLVNQTLLRAGDTVVIEESNYGGVYTRFNRLDVSFAGVPTDSHGMRIDALEQVLSELKQKGTMPRYIYTIPTVQNPTGSVMPEDRRRGLLALAKAFDVPVFEDDCYADLTFDGNRPPALHALDEDGRVIYCGSFSKTVAPALRVGYLVARQDFLARAISYKTDAGSGALEQLVLAEFCVRQFDSHVKKLSKHLAKKADLICTAFDKYFGASADYVRPMGGIFIWV
ncbi:MAG: PLP-dependent aminotransferase family protein, partial [Pseudomonadota bacterium]|nr:PLP-dependent aminotransferase family protein [Pseudomonadota bacterium]